MASPDDLVRSWLLSGPGSFVGYATEQGAVRAALAASGLPLSLGDFQLALDRAGHRPRQSRDPDSDGYVWHLHLPQPERAGEHHLSRRRTLVDGRAGQR